mgnify:CR=1 FL=1
MTGVDHAHALIAGSVVQRPDVATVEREHRVGAEGHERGDGLLSGVAVEVTHLDGGRGLGHAPSLPDAGPARPIVGNQNEW